MKKTHCYKILTSIVILHAMSSSAQTGIPRSPLNPLPFAIKSDAQARLGMIGTYECADDHHRSIYRFFQNGVFAGTLYPIANGREVTMLADHRVGEWRIAADKIYVTTFKQFDPPNWRARREDLVYEYEGSQGGLTFIMVANSQRGEPYKPAHFKDICLGASDSKEYDGFIMNSFNSPPHE